jgi:hypothetical protein
MATAIADTAWAPGRFGVLSSTQTVDGEPSTVSIQHHMFPFSRELEASGQSFLERSLQTTALDYLIELNRREQIHLPQEWLDALQLGAGDSTFGWMPIGWPPEPGHEADDNAADPFVSYRLQRKTTDGTQPDQTVILLASEKLAGKFIGSGFGVALVVNVRSPETGKFEAQIVGLSASIPYGPYKNGLFNTDWAKSSITQAELLGLSLSEQVKQEMASVLSLSSAAVRSLRFSRGEGNDEWEVERRGTGPAGPSPDQAYSFAFVGTDKTAGKLISRVVLQADADAYARVFPIDPASQSTNVGYRGRRPSRNDAELDPLRAPSQFPTAPAPLQYSDATGRELMCVIACPEFVRADIGAASGSAESVDLQGGAPVVHSDNSSAISSFYNATQMFDHLIAYGLDPFDYFRFGDLPLSIAYRSGMQAGPGKDGQTINACVKVEGWPFDFIGPTKVGERPLMEMRLALADMSRRGRKPWDRVNRSVAEPFGIAADERWMWHEFGHVLLVAAVGELEFRFAHSSGDALAAIALDPDSQMAKADPEGISYWRGMTFPWVFIPRRHDRCVSCGWSWGGTMHSALASVPDSVPPRRKAYLSEQILSSSLFRLYRALGGDTIEENAEDINTRHAASHYCLYLIMDAIRGLGFGAAVQLKNDPVQFVIKLLDVDTNAGEWNVTFPLVGGEMYSRVGGCAYKVIRWAFEAQGLYAAAGAITNAPGLPLAVDVYIADGRTAETTESGIITYGPGNYAPVSLHWDVNQRGVDQQGGGDPVPAWQARPDVVVLQADGIHVFAGNRGTADAHAVQVSVYWIEWPANSPPPTWNSAGWMQCAAIAAQDIAAGANSVPFGPFQFAPPAQRRYIVLAKASCIDDLAIPDVSNFACSSKPTRLVDLVAGDNNLGLRVVTLP